MVLISFYKKIEDTGVSIEEYLSKIKKYKICLKGLKDLNYIIDEFTLLLYLYPLKDNRLKILSKLNPDAKYGFITEHLIRCCHQIGVPKNIIARYKSLKGRYTYYKNAKSSWGLEELPKVKNELKDMTLMLTVSCITEWSTQKIRDKKIKSILIND